MRLVANIPLATVAAVAILALAACGEDRSTEQGGLATTTSVAAQGGSEQSPPPSGPLDRLVAERIGDLELGENSGAPEIRELGAEDARNLSYTGEGERGAVLSIARFPTPQRARAYARQFAAVLGSGNDFKRTSGPRSFDGREGEGSIVILDDDAGTEASIWTTGPIFVDAIGDPPVLETLLAEAPFGER